MTDIATLRRILAEEYGIHSDKELRDAPKNNPKVNMAARNHIRAEEVKILSGCPKI